MFTLIENGEVYAPEPLGRRPVLLVGDRIARIGETDARLAASTLELDLEVVDASGCVVTPGFIDPPRPEVEPCFLYPAHINRSRELLAEAIDLARRGSHVDTDCAEEDSAVWVRRYLDEGGDPARLTLSSDSDSSAPRRL